MHIKSPIFVYSDKGTLRSMDLQSGSEAPFDSDLYKKHWICSQGDTFSSSVPTTCGTFLPKVFDVNYLSRGLATIELNFPLLSAFKGEIDLSSPRTLVCFQVDKRGFMFDGLVTQQYEPALHASKLMKHDLIVFREESLFPSAPIFPTEGPNVCVKPTRHLKQTLCLLSREHQTESAVISNDIDSYSMIYSTDYPTEFSASLSLIKKLHFPPCASDVYKVLGYWKIQTQKPLQPFALTLSMQCLLFKLIPNGGMISAKEFQELLTLITGRCFSLERAMAVVNSQADFKWVDDTITRVSRKFL